MDKSSIMQLLSIGENREIEFKESKNKLPKSLWETYSAFCNTKGRYNCFRNKGR
jgi:predicted HTH transcriptional regulator